MEQESQAAQPSLDRKISLACLDCFSTPAGQMVLAYLKVSFNAVTPDTITDAQLRYREGQRSVIGIIEQRMKEARHEPESAADGSSTSRAGGRSRHRAHASGHPARAGKPAVRDAAG